MNPRSGWSSASLADDPDAFAAQEERRSSWRRAKRGGVVACGVVAGRGELPGSSSVSDGHACVPRALAARAINDDPAVSSDGGLAAQLTRRPCVACVETLVQQARALIMTGTHGHVFLELCRASDSELAAAVVEHSVAIRVTSSEDLQLDSTRYALHRLLRICEAYDVVVDIWVSIPCTVGSVRKNSRASGPCRYTFQMDQGYLQVDSCSHRFVSTRCANWWWFLLGMDQ